MNFNSSQDYIFKPLSFHGAWKSVDLETPVSQKVVEVYNLFEWISGNWVSYGKEQSSQLSKKEGTSILPSVLQELLFSEKKSGSTKVYKKNYYNTIFGLKIPPSLQEKNPSDSKSLSRTKNTTSFSDLLPILQSFIQTTLKIGLPHLNL